MADAPLIVAERLSRHYRVQKDSLRSGRFGGGLLRREMDTVRAVEDVSFSIDRATAVALIGLNGAGKSTLLKLITGVLVPSSGELSVAGMQPFERRRQLARRVGVVFGHRTQLWWDVPLMDSMKVLRRIYRVRDADYHERLERLTALLELGDLLPRAPRQMSLGQRVRGEIMASLLHGPDLLILDEPTVGLDILAKASIRKLVRSLVDDDGVTVILASHEVSDIEQICDRAILLHQGRILYQGSLEQLKSQADVERSLSLEILCEGADGVKIERVTVPLSGPDGAQRLAEAARMGTVAGASVTGGSLEAILARMFSGRN